VQRESAVLVGKVLCHDRLRGIEDSHNSSWHWLPISPQDDAFDGAFWLGVALPVDFVGFVLIKNPISLSPYDFYVGQFPWIYLIYIAVFLSPSCYVALTEFLGRKALA